METKEIKVQIPDGYEIDKENSTFECIKFKPKKKGLTYKYVSASLFGGRRVYYPDAHGACNKVYLSTDTTTYSDATNCTSEEQVEKLMAFNKLINVAKYLNENWKPDFRDYTVKYFLIIDDNQQIDIISRVTYSLGTPCFKSIELAKQAIEILGEDTIKLALTQV